jgi:hypothetical protein
MIMLHEVQQTSDEFDVLHFHIDFLHAPVLRNVADRTVATSTADWICRISRSSMGFSAAALIGPARSIMVFPAICGAGGMKARWAISAYGGFDERDSARRTTPDWRIQDDSLRALSDSAT